MRRASTMADIRAEPEPKLRELLAGLQSYAECLPEAGHAKQYGARQLLLQEA